MKKNKIIYWLAGGFLGVVVFGILLDVFKISRFDDSLGGNILVIGRNGMSIIGLRPKNEMIFFLNLPDDLIIPLSSNGGELRAEAYRRGLREKNSLELTRDSVSKAMGVAIGGVLKAEVKTDPAGLIEGVWSSIQTNLSFSDRYRVYKATSALVQKGREIELNLPMNTYDEVEEADGVVSKRLNQAVYAWNRNQWVYEQILNQGAEVSLVNATGIDGYARTYSRLVDSAGGRVVELISGKKIYQGGCMVLGNKEMWLETIKFLEVNLNCKHNTSEKIEDWSGRELGTDVVLVLGSGK